MHSTWQKVLAEYQVRIPRTDQLPAEEVQAVLMGLFGEAGSVMAPAKKLHREGGVYIGYIESAEEEFGDLLWYFAALLRRNSISLSEVFATINYQDQSGFVSESSQERSACVIPQRAVDELLVQLGRDTAALMETKGESVPRPLIQKFAETYLASITAVDLSLSRVIQRNLAKAEGRFLDPEPRSLPTFDADFPREERLPHHFEIAFTQRRSGQCFLQMNDVFIGDPLTDNIVDRDDYRFHDVFHMAHAAILHWSPVLRALLKRKRKSDSETDETQDGGRAIVVEEGIAAWLFSYAKNVDYFAGAKRVPYDLLKQISQFTKGYEVAECPLRLWEQAILAGYRVFRQVRDAKGGIVIGHRDTRTITYKPFTEK